MPEYPYCEECSGYNYPSLSSPVSQRGRHCGTAVPKSRAIVFGGIIIVFLALFFVVGKEARYCEASCSSSGHWAVVIWCYATSCVDVFVGGRLEYGVEYSSRGQWEVTCDIPEYKVILVSGRIVSIRGSQEYTLYSSYQMLELSECRQAGAAR